MIKVPSLWIGRQVAFGKFYTRNLTTWASASSNLLMTHRALDYCINSVSDQLAGERAKLVTVFFGTQHLKFATQIAEETAKRINSEVIVGCSTDTGIIGPNENVELKSGMVITALPLNENAKVTTFLTNKSTVPSNTLSELENNENTKNLILMGHDQGTMVNITEDFCKKFPNNQTAVGVLSIDKSFYAGLERSCIVNGKSYQSGSLGVIIENSNMKVLRSYGVAPISTTYEITDMIEDTITTVNNEPIEKLFYSAFKELRELGALSDDSSIQIGLLKQPDADENDVESYELQLLSNFAPERLLTPTSGFCQVGDKFRLFVKSPKFCLGDWQNYVKEKEHSPKGIYMFHSLHRGSPMHGKSRKEHHIIESGFDCPISGVFTSTEVIGKYSKYLGSTNSLVIYFYD